MKNAIKIVFAMVFFCGFCWAQTVLSSGPIINGVCHTNLESGSSLDARWNACNAANTAGHVSSHVIDASAEGGVQNIYAQMNAGDSTGTTVEFILPAYCYWKVDALGTSSTAGNAIYAFNNSIIRSHGQTNGKGCALIANFSANYSIYSFYNNTPVGGNYSIVENLATYNPKYLTASGYNWLIEGGADTSRIMHLISQAYGNIQTTVSTSGTAVAAANGTPFLGMPTGIGIYALVNNVLYNVRGVTSGGAGLTLATSAGTQSSVPFSFAQSDIYFGNNASCCAFDVQDLYVNNNNTGGFGVFIYGGGPFTFNNTSVSAHPFPGYPAFFCGNAATVNFSGAFYEEENAATTSYVKTTVAGNIYTMTWVGGQQFWSLAIGSQVNIPVLKVPSYYTVSGVSNPPTSAAMTANSGTPAPVTDTAAFIPASSNPWNVNQSCQVTTEGQVASAVGGGNVVVNAPIWQEQVISSSQYSLNLGPIVARHGFTLSEAVIQNLNMPTELQSVYTDSNGHFGEGYHADYYSSLGAASPPAYFDRVSALIGVRVGQVLMPSVGTLTANAIIAPVTNLTHITGTGTINTITPLASCTLSGTGCQITLIFDLTTSLGTSGNIVHSLTSGNPGTVAVLNYDPSSTTCASEPGCWYVLSGSTAYPGAGGAYVLFGGSVLTTPAGTQYMSPSGRMTISSDANAVAFVAPRAMTLTGIQASVSNPVGSTKGTSLSFTVNTCTTSACSATTTTAVSCIIGNDANQCSASGFTAAVAAGTPIVVRTVQTLTGTAAIGSVSIMYQ
jgi:hypothetical protein